MATPAVAALLCCGAFPSLWVICLGITTVFAGYTTVYALNDLVDCRVDKKKSERIPVPEKQNDLDAIFVRHPVACGLLSFRKALLWAMGWGVLTVVGALLLNPFCVVIFVMSCLLEVVYCLAWGSSYLKVIISGTVKTSGAVAAIYAVNPDPPFLFLALVFLWLFFWEIGGQNVPNDWADIEEDTILEATTIPVRFGLLLTTWVICISLIVTVALSGLLFSFSPVKNPFFSCVLSVGVGVYLLLIPAYKLCRMRNKSAALALFNGASYYPVAVLAGICSGMIL